MSKLYCPECGKQDCYAVYAYPVLFILIGIIIALMFTSLVGCNEVQKAPEEAQPKTNIKPLNEQLIDARQDWKDAYGDTLESQMAYNLVILRNNQLEIAKMIAKLHPPIDPNEPIDPNQ